MFKVKCEPKLKDIFEPFQASPILYVDETGWKVNRGRVWFHTICSNNHPYFLVTQRRADKEISPIVLLCKYRGSLLLDDFKSFFSLTQDFLNKYLS
ncbi:IS66 family transposase [Erysipelothrix larvae]|uniref:IS66 family transposase n=1 Tax=Erysipelothrix larvae TaxID=1514105 RepID=UPI003AAC6A6A